MNCDPIELTLNRKTAEHLYRFLYNSEKSLTEELILFLDKMERDHFGSYTIEEMEVLTSGKKY